MVRRRWSLHLHRGRRTFLGAGVELTSLSHGQAYRLTSVPGVPGVDTISDRGGRVAEAFLPIPAEARARGRASRGPRGPCQLRPPHCAPDMGRWEAIVRCVEHKACVHYVACSSGELASAVRVYVRGQGEQREGMGARGLVVRAFCFWTRVLAGLAARVRFVRAMWPGPSVGRMRSEDLVRLHGDGDGDGSRHAYAHCQCRGWCVHCVATLRPSGRSVRWRWEPKITRMDLTRLRHKDVSTRIAQLR
ncbi:hypothetical protein OH76DRAFT_690457 [Lentinus brumalis]|uniref:Uncharacterized protein n=1 Tax=Lentinus brumalis TaxID=2498619 RepID=A0A371D648_9APHY|nr:hypothetical protein OH76DRAFT_690457 [Polyporus brumalis]